MTSLRKPFTLIAMFKKICFFSFLGFLLVCLCVFKKTSFEIRETVCNSNAKIKEKVLICGVGRNVEKAFENTKASIQKLGSEFLDYRVIIYENNSTDLTKKCYEKWALQDPHVIFFTEKLSSREIRKRMEMKQSNRTEKIAMARNRVLDAAMDPRFNDYQYVVWADLDFLEPWSVDEIVETVLHPKKEWDAVFANGAYDLFALRSKQFPVGFELLGDTYWKKLDLMWENLKFEEDGSWMDVYSAFGGIGIYKRDSLKGCRYSGVVTRDLEKATNIWLSQSKRNESPLFLSEYENLLSESQIVNTSWGLPLKNRERYPDRIGVSFEKGNIVWLSCTDRMTLPWTCEHVPLHASMMLKGNGRFFINPKIKCNP